jgi:pre-mRNA-splicing factor 18
MEALKSEIERKRKATATLQSEKGGGIGGLTSKYMRQGDYRQLLEKEREEEKRRLVDDRRPKASLATAEVPVLSSSTSSSSSSSSSVFDSLTVEDVQHRVTELKQPANVSGETKQEQVGRLVQAIATANEQAELQDDASIEPGDNDEEKEEEEDEEEEDRRGKREEDAFGSVIYSTQPNLSREKAVYKYFRSLLKQWESDLSMREDREKATAKGKMDSKTLRQCKDHIRPLFKMCKMKSVPPDILEKLFDMVKFCEMGNFRVAHDHYYLAAIGNAAWPIGLTMVGIHERSGREKINTGKVAHVMNNELQRKYLTAVKRLMSFAQVKRPDVPPSMKVN